MDENKELVETMEDYAEELEASFKRLHEGDIVTGTVVAVTDDQVLVDLKYFAQGVIDRENLSNDPDFNMKDEIQPGDLLTATVIQTDDGEGNVVLSRKEANDRMTWEHFRQLLDERTPLEVTISEVVNGGAVAMVEGVRGFIPASRLDAAYVEDLDSWNGKKIPVLVRRRNVSSCPAESWREKNRMRRRRAGLRAVRPARSWKERSRQSSHTARLSCWKMA